jgi:formylglycine-generating enzyme required for sulfatase activity
MRSAARAGSDGAASPEPGRGNPDVRVRVAEPPRRGCRALAPETPFSAGVEIVGGAGDDCAMASPQAAAARRVRSSAPRTPRWGHVGLVAGMVAGCVGLPPPPPLRDGTTSEAAGTSGAGDSSTDAGETTDATPGCGNGAVEPGEPCDGAAVEGLRCEDLGLPSGSVACTDCRIDVSGCGAPPGMVLVPAGAFTMGSMLWTNEQPVRTVTLDAFWIDELEVSVAAYATCVASGACDLPPEVAAFNYGVAGRDDHPINGIDWFGADLYCRWVDGGSRRLPTEAEWEKAARGTGASSYPWGNAEANCTRVVMADDDGVAGCGAGSTASVGSKPLGASEYGALDMAGNVQEWVSDWYGPYDATATQSPTGPIAGRYRVLRGGAWDDVNPSEVRAASRNLEDPADHTVTVGFRCVRPAMLDGFP